MEDTKTIMKGGVILETKEIYEKFEKIAERQSETLNNQAVLSNQMASVIDCCKDFKAETKMMKNEQTKNTQKINFYSKFIWMLISMFTMSSLLASCGSQGWR